MTATVEERLLVADYADLARLAHVSGARLTQIMDLVLLAPDIQEALLLLPSTDGGGGAIRERTVRRMCAVADWRRQRKMWGSTPIGLGSYRRPRATCG